MANIGQSILALLTGAGQGIQNARAQAPINAANNLAVQQAQAGISDDAAAMQYFSSIGLNGGNGANPPTPAIPTSGAMPPSPGGGSILPPSPGQASVPMQSPAAVPVPVAVQKPPAPAAAAPVNQNAMQAQSPVDNPILSSLQMYAPVLRDPKFQALSPGAKKIVLAQLQNIQQVQAQRQQQMLRQKNEELLGQVRQKELAGQYNPSGRQPKPMDNTAMSKGDIEYAAGLKAQMQRLQTKADTLSAHSDPQAERAQQDADRAADSYKKFMDQHNKASSANEEEEGEESGDGERVSVVDKDGNEFTVPPDQLDDAIAQGYKKK